jgi:hypothetical protein
VIDHQALKGGNNRPTFKYGPTSHIDSDEQERRFYAPATRLNPRSVKVVDFESREVSLQGTSRRSILFRNLGPSTVYISDSPDVHVGAPGDSAAGFPLSTGEQMNYAVTEYNGPFWARCDVGGAAELRVIEPA